MDEHEEVILIVNGMKRKTYFYIPRGYEDKKIPIVVVLHGGGGNGKGMIMNTKMSDYAKKMGFAVVYPSGFSNRWNDGRRLKHAATDKRKTPDILYMKRIRDYFSKHYNVDPEKSYLTGFSNGGFMVTRTICDSKDLFHAYAVVGAGISVPYKPKCKNPDSKPILFIWGMKDEIVPFQGGEMIVPTNQDKISVGFTHSFHESLDFFGNKFACKSKREENVSGLFPPLSGNVIKTSYTECNSPATVEGFALSKTGHTWPGGFYFNSSQDYGYNSGEFNATEKILDFFERQTTDKSSDSLSK